MWDSLKNVDIYTTVESELGAYFSPEEVDQMHDVNLGGFVRMVEANLAYQALAKPDAVRE